LLVPAVLNSDHPGSKIDVLDAEGLEFARA